jgi:hypothetical protein
MVHTDTAGVLDVVVLGGGGHVGLLLSLALADAGLRAQGLVHQAPSPGDG